jgi:hypothetical protein
MTNEFAQYISTKQAQMLEQERQAMSAQADKVAKDFVADARKRVQTYHGGEQVTEIFVPIDNLAFTLEILYPIDVLMGSSVYPLDLLTIRISDKIEVLGYEGLNPVWVEVDALRFDGATISVSGVTGTSTINAYNDLEGWLFYGFNPYVIIEDIRIEKDGSLINASTEFIGFYADNFTTIDIDGTDFFQITFIEAITAVTPNNADTNLAMVKQFFADFDNQYLFNDDIIELVALWMGSAEDLWSAIYTRYFTDARDSMTAGPIPTQDFMMIVLDRDIFVIDNVEGMAFFMGEYKHFEVEYTEDTITITNIRNLPTDFYFVITLEGDLLVLTLMLPQSYLTNTEDIDIFWGFGLGILDRDARTLILGKFSFTR